MEFQALAARLRAARERAGLTQAEAVRGLKLSAAALSHYEAGRRSIDALTLEHLARRYGVTATALLCGEAPALPWEVTLRELSHDLSADGKVGIGGLISRLADFERLLDIVDIAPVRFVSPFRPLVSALGDQQTAVSSADETRRFFELGHAPIPDMRGFLEAHGILVFSAPLGSGADDVAGICLQHDRLGSVIVVNEDHAVSRWPFTLAHEFAHCLYHDDRAAILCRSLDCHAVERFADQFASHFLMPDAALRRSAAALQPGGLTAAEQTARLARLYGVSFKVMQRRLQRADLLDPADSVTDIHAAALERALGFEQSPYERGQRPLPLELRVPRVFLELAFNAFQEDRLSLLLAAQLLGVSDLELEMRWFDIPTAEPVERLELYA